MPPLSHHDSSTAGLATAAPNSKANGSSSNGQPAPQPPAGQSSAGYKQPPKEILDVVDAPAQPALTFSPDRKLVSLHAAQCWLMSTPHLLAHARRGGGSADRCVRVSQHTLSGLLQHYPVMACRRARRACAERGVDMITGFGSSQQQQYKEYQSELCVSFSAGPPLKPAVNCSDDQFACSSVAAGRCHGSMLAAVWLNIRAVWFGCCRSCRCPGHHHCRRSLRSPGLS